MASIFSSSLIFHGAVAPPAIAAMGQVTSSTSLPTQQPTASGCPIKHDQIPAPSNDARPKLPAECPISHSPAPASTTTRPAECPILHERPADTLNPLNNIPNLSQSPSASQASNLPTDREVSSIPRAAGGAKWEYPSPQQFYNALVRKGWETPEEHVQMMVHIHNFLNEKAWDEVMTWERRRDR